MVQRPPVLRMATQPWAKVFDFVKAKKKAIAKIILKVRFIINSRVCVIEYCYVIEYWFVMHLINFLSHLSYRVVQHIGQL